ncbi:MAG TPA: methyltransferase domain-containing protein [Candidatus Polarisedimenticolia bacterium]|jgi:ubiquinone/menaquinone biosynthesis C-methylase UbiE
MFTRSARWYDNIYSFKNHAREASLVHELIRAHGRSPGARLLDVGCGTGEHIRYLRSRYEVEGLDLDAAMLEVARSKHPDLVFHEASMLDFDLGSRFDAVVSLFSSVGYLKTADRLRRSVANMARHLVAGGVLLVEPWLAPESFQPGKLGSAFVDDPDLKIARFSVCEVEDRISVMDFHYLVATPAGVETFTERHELALFTREEYLAAFEACGMEPVFDPEGPTGRGLYLGVRSPAAARYG